MKNDTQRQYLFITLEGITFSSAKEIEPDVDNCQIVGYAEGFNEEDAFKNLISKNPWIINTNFDELVCIEVKQQIREGKRFYLSDIRDDKSRDNKS